MNFIHSVAYYPELWDNKVIKRDITHMKKLGINTVRIGEFDWSELEPNENEFHFVRFSEIMDMLYNAGINIILCTPTATPPIWMSHGHPERMYRDSVLAVVHGGRQHICTNNPYFRKRVQIIVEKIAEHLGRKAGVIGWQIDNELKCNVGECYCEECNTQWHSWLKNKYKTISELNSAWGTGVWSQYYRDFSEVPQPFRTPPTHNPSLETNYYLFSHDKVNEFVKLQSDIIRKYSSAPITHNSAPFFRVNNDELSKFLDFPSFDLYPSSTSYRLFLYACDRFRGLNKDGKFMCMETSPGYNGFTKGYENIHPSGFVKAEATAVMALGGIGFAYWHFHQHRAGCELIHGSIISADGTPNLCYNQVEQARDRITEMESRLEGMTRAKADVAIHASDKARAFMQTEYYDGMDYNSLLEEIYGTLANKQIFRDIIPLDADVSGYKVVFTPFIYSLDSEFVNKMEEFCEKGGLWVVGPMTAIRTSDHTVKTDCALGSELEKILGVKNTSIFPTRATDFSLEFKGKISKMRYLAIGVDCDTSIGLAQLKNTDFKDFVITENNISNGRAVLFGAMPENPEVLSEIIDYVINSAGVSSNLVADDGIFTVPWEKGDDKYIVAFDMKGNCGSIKINDNAYQIEKYGFDIIKIL